MAASHRWTGAAEPAARLAAAETQAGHEVLFALTAGASFDEQARALGLRTTGAVAFERSYLPWKKWRDLQCLRALVAEFRPDIIHAHLTHDHMLAVAALGKPSSTRPRLVRTFHREEPVRAGLLQRRFLMARTDGAGVISSAMRDRLDAAFGWGEERVLLLGGAIDTGRFQPNGRGERMRGKWSIAAGDPVAGIVSRLRVERGIAWLLDAAEDVLPILPDARVVICGRGNYEQEMLKRLEMHPSAPQIVHAGYVTGEDLEDSYNAFDVAVLLRPGNDGTCRAALEAMACGRPVIAGDIGSLHDLIAGRDVGWLVPDGDRDALAGALIDALSNLEECRRRGQLARQLVLEHYDEAAQAARMIAFYERLLASRPGDAER